MTVNYPVLKAFLIDLATTIVTLVVAWLTVPENLEAAGIGDAIIPIVVGLSGAALVALRRYRIVKASR